MQNLGIRIKLGAAFGAMWALAAAGIAIALPRMQGAGDGNARNLLVALGVAGLGVTRGRPYRSVRWPASSFWSR